MSTGVCEDKRRARGGAQGVPEKEEGVMCVRNLGRLEQLVGCSRAGRCNATARGIEQNGRASRSATPPTRGRHLAAAPSGPGAKTAVGKVLHPVSIGNKKHTDGTGTRRFFTRKYRLIPGVSSDARGQRERQNVKQKLNSTPSISSY